MSAHRPTRVRHQVTVRQVHRRVAPRPQVAVHRAGPLRRAAAHRAVRQVAVRQSATHHTIAAVHGGTTPVLGGMIPARPIRHTGRADQEF